jgi:hypothetical protein
VIFRNKLIYLRKGVLSPTPNTQVGGPSFVGCPRLLLQYIRSYPLYLEAVVKWVPASTDTHANGRGTVGL